MRSDEGAFAVDDEQLAVVAQVGAPEAPLVGQQWHHKAPADASGGEAMTQVPPPRVLARPEVIDEQAHGDAPGRGPLERAVEDVGDRIP